MKYHSKEHSSVLKDPFFRIRLVGYAFASILPFSHFPTQVLAESKAQS